MNPAPRSYNDNFENPNDDSMTSCPLYKREMQTCSALASYSQKFLIVKFALEFTSYLLFVVSLKWFNRAILRKFC